MNKKLSFVALVLLLSASLMFVSLPISMTKAATVGAWDFEDHGLTHTDIPTMTGPEQLEAELLAMNSLFAEHSLPTPKHYDYPNGAVIDDAISVIAQYRDTARTSGTAPFPNIYGSTDWYKMGAANIDENKTFADVKAWIDTAVVTKGLAIIYTHDIADPAPTYGTTPAILQSVVDYLVEQQTAGNLTVETMRQAYSNFNGQKAVVVMAFDDGTTSDYTVVWPMFKAAGLVGTSYIVGNWIGVQPTVMTWAQVQEMAQVGPYTPPQHTATAWGAFMEVAHTGGGTTNFASGSLVALPGGLYANATPAVGYVFDHWIFKGANYNDSFILFPQQPYGTIVTVTAVFRSINATPSTTWSMNVTTQGLGATNPSGLVNVTSGPTRVNATASTGSIFSYWQFDNANVTSAFNVTSTNTTSTILVPAQVNGSNHTLTAFFNPVWNLTVTVNGTVGGTTSPSGNMTVLTGSVTVNATATANYTFSVWQLDNVTIGNATMITVPPQTPGSSHVLTAVFVRSTLPSAVVATDTKP